MIRVVPVIGVPAAGKSTIFRKLIANMREKGKLRTLKYGTVRGYISDARKVIVLGIYDENPFSGTDRLSMAVSPEVQKLLEMLNRRKEYDGWVVTWEGDRLASGALFDYMTELGCLDSVVCICAAPEDIERRQKLRSNKQDATWRAGRESKVNNLCSRYNVKKLQNSTNQQLEEAVKFIYGKLAPKADVS